MRVAWPGAVPGEGLLAWEVGWPVSGEPKQVTLSWEVQRSANFSPCRTWRYSLTRSWGSNAAGLIEPLVVVGLNPSTADETQDDPTIRRCMGFAERWGFGALLMLNMFAYRSTDPGVIYDLDVETAIGPDNNACLAKLAEGRTVLAAWGRHGRTVNPLREIAVWGLLQEVGAELVCLGTNKDGSPAHPLYQPKDAKRVPWRLA